MCIDTKHKALCLVSPLEYPTWLVVLMLDGRHVDVSYGHYYIPAVYNDIFIPASDYRRTLAKPASLSTRDSCAMLRQSESPPSCRLASASKQWCCTFASSRQHSASIAWRRALIAPHCSTSATYLGTGGAAGDARNNLSVTFNWPVARGPQMPQHFVRTPVPVLFCVHAFPPSATARR